MSIYNSLFVEFQNHAKVITDPRSGKKIRIPVDRHNSESMRAADLREYEIKTEIIEDLTKRLDRQPTTNELHRGMSDGIDNRTI